jgi:hypothetical protein
LVSAIGGLNGWDGDMLLVVSVANFSGSLFPLNLGKTEFFVLAVCEAMIGSLNGWDGELVARGHFALIKR